MPQTLDNKLVIAISSRALFNLDDSHQVFVNEGLDAYSAYQVSREEEPLEPGEAFPLVHKLLRLNESLGGESQVEVVLLSRNSADTGLRVFNSIQHYELAISRAAFWPRSVVSLNTRTIIARPFVGSPVPRAPAAVSPEAPGCFCVLAGQYISTIAEKGRKIDCLKGLGDAGIAIE